MRQEENAVINPLDWGKKIEAVRNRMGIRQKDLFGGAGIGAGTYQKIKEK